MTPTKFTEIADQLKAAVLKKANWTHSDDQQATHHEVKRFDANYDDNLQIGFVTVEVGMIGDENSMASILCRDYRHVMIGKRGGTRLLNTQDKNHQHGWFNAVHALTK